MAVKLKENLYWVGAKDPNLRIFDIVMRTPFGTTYNSYLLRGSKATVLIETVKEQFFGEFDKRLGTVLEPGEKIDFFVLNHTEPDHSGSLAFLLERFPEAKVVGTSAAHSNLGSIVHRNYNKIVANETTTPIDIGGLTLKFINTMFTFVEEISTVFTCDFLGTHYCLPDDGVVDDKMTEKQKLDFLTAAKGYFDPIFGPFKSYSLRGLELLSRLRFDIVCNSHGPILRNLIREVISLYNQWSQPPVLKEHIVIAFVSAYGYTRKMAEALRLSFEAAGVSVTAYDLVDVPVEKVMEDMEQSRGLILGTPTILGDALPPIWQIATSLNPIIHRDRIVGVFGSVGWSGEGTRNIEQRLEQLRIRMPLEPLQFHFRPSDSDLEKSKEWASKFARAFRGEKLPDEGKGKKKKAATSKEVPFDDGRLRRWKCLVCGEIVISVLPPAVCGACGAGQEAFVCLGFAGEASQAERSSFSGHVVIIGGGCAAIAAAKAAREGSESARITVVCGEREEPYYRPTLTRILADRSVRSEKSFRLLPAEWWSANRVEILIGASATGVDTTGRIVDVQLATGEKVILRYDSLIIATGGKNFVPCPPDQTSARGVFNLRVLADVNAIAAFIDERKTSGLHSTAVVVGGGLAALQAAAALSSLGVSCHMIEMQKRLLPRQLTEEASRRYTDAVIRAGVALHMGTSVKQIVRNSQGSVAGVILANGETISADLVVFGVGTVPELDFARLAGVTIKKGIVVDEKMETSVPGVFGAGDCTEFGGRNIPNWTEATGQGRAAGLQAVGAIKFEGATFKRIASPYWLDAFRTVFSIGAVPVDPTPNPPRSVSFSLGGDFAELFFSENGDVHTIIGAQIVGRRAKKLQTPITMAIAANATLDQVVNIVVPEFLKPRL